MLPYDEESLQKRTTVWVILSDLFLDTDTADCYEYIARVCAESAYTLEELKEILENEVAPAVSVNLLSVAGIWSGFNEEWLVETIRKNIQKDLRPKHALLKRFLKPFKSFGFKSYIKNHWKRLEVIILEKRTKD